METSHYNNTMTKVPTHKQVGDTTGTKRKEMGASADTREPSQAGGRRGPRRGQHPVLQPQSEGAFARRTQVHRG